MSKIVSFSDFLNQKASRMMDMLTPEDKLKLFAINQFMGMDEITRSLKIMSIDDLFIKVAEGVLDE